MQKCNQHRIKSLILNKSQKKGEALIQIPGYKYEIYEMLQHVNDSEHLLSNSSGCPDY